MEAWNYSILINEKNVMRSVSLWVIIKNLFKIIGCKLYIKTLQPLGLAFFNSITKFSTI